MDYKILNDGNKIPMLGYGVFLIPEAECADCVTRALECGYRHIDTAQIYGNEAGVGEGLSRSGLPRGQVFITSKVWVTEFGYDKTLKSIDLSLKKLKTDYIDLMLLHRPFFDYKGAWKALLKARDEGLVKSIGISNFNVKQTEDILAVADVVPAVNQIELHPYFGQKQLSRYLSEKGIVVEAWYPLGHGNKKLLGDKVVTALAEKYGKTPSQIILRWHLELGNIIFPKTCSAAHMEENLGVFSFSLSKDDIAAINALDKNKPLFNVPDWLQKFLIKMRK